MKRLYEAPRMEKRLEWKPNPWAREIVVRLTPEQVDLYGADFWLWAGEVSGRVICKGNRRLKPKRLERERGASASALVARERRGK